MFGFGRKRGAENQVTKEQMQQRPDDFEKARRAKTRTDLEDPTVRATFGEQEKDSTELTDKDKQFIDGLSAYYKIEDMQKLEKIIEQMTPMENDMLNKAKTEMDLLNLIQHLADRIESKKKAEQII